MEPQQPAVTPPQPPVPPTPPPLPVKNSLLMIMAILLLIAVGLAGFLYYQNQQLKSMLASYQSPATPTPSATPDITADWKTYTNDKLGFNFKYPEGYKVEERVPGYIVISLQNESIPQGGIGIETRGQNPYDSINSAQNYIRDSLEVTQNTKIGPWDIYQGTGKEGMIKGIEFRQAIAPYKNKAIEAETIATTAYVDVFDQILSTFKFLGQ